MACIYGYVFFKGFLPEFLREFDHWMHRLSGYPTSCYCLVVVKFLYVTPHVSVRKIREQVRLFVTPINPQKPQVELTAIIKLSQKSVEKVPPH